MFLLIGLLPFRFSAILSIASFAISASFCGVSFPLSFEYLVLIRLSTSLNISYPISLPIAANIFMVCSSSLYPCFATILTAVLETLFVNPTSSSVLFVALNLSRKRSSAFLTIFSSSISVLSMFDFIAALVSASESAIEPLTSLPALYVAPIALPTPTIPAPAPAPIAALVAAFFGEPCSMIDLLSRVSPGFGSLSSC